MVLTAQDLVATPPGAASRLVGVTDDDDLALGDHDPVLDARVVRGALAAPAQGLDLQDLRAVGELDQPRGAREEPGPEVGQDAEAEDVDAQLVDDPGQRSTCAAV